MLSTLKRWHDAGYQNIYGTDAIEGWCSVLARPVRSTIRILDIGCGNGRDLLAIGSAIHGAENIELYGIECTESLAKQARLKGVQTFVVDLECETLPFADGFFDIVVANQVLEHLKNWVWAFSEQVRVTKAGGTSILGVPNLAALHNRILVAAGRQPSCIKADGPHVRGFTLHELHRLVESVKGLEVSNVAGTVVYGMPPVVGKWLARRMPAWSATILLGCRKTVAEVDVLSLLGEDARFETNYFSGKPEMKVRRIGAGGES